MRQMQHQTPYRRGYSPYMQSGDNLTYTESIPEFYGKPVEDYAHVGNELYQRGEQNRIAYEELALTAEMDMQNIREKFKDGADGQAILDSVSRIEKGVQDYVEGGNFHNAGRVVSNLYRGYITDEKRQAAIGAKQQQDANIQAIRDREDLPQDYKNAFINLATSDAYNKSIDEGGYIGYTPNEFFDFQQAILELEDKWKTDNITTQGYDLSTLGSSPFLQGSAVTQGGLGMQEFMQGAMKYLSSNPKAEAWLNSLYDLNTANPDGSTRPATRQELVSMALPLQAQVDDKGKPIDREILNSNANNAIQGRVARLQQSYRDAGRDIGDEQALELVRKQIFKESQLYDSISSVSEIMTNTVYSYKQLLEKDYIYEGRIKKQSEGDAYVRKLGAIPELVDPKELDRNLSVVQGEIDMYQASVNSAEPGSAEYENALYNLRRSQNRQADIEFLLDDLYRTSDRNSLKSDIDRYGKVSTQYGNLTFKERFGIGSDELIDLIINRDEKSLRNLLNDRVSQFHRSVPYNELDNNSKSIIDERIDNYISDFLNMPIKHIAVDKLTWHENMISITPEDNRSADWLERVKSDMLENSDLAFTTFTGNSSADEDFQENIKGADDIHIHYTGNVRNGDLLFNVVWKKEGKVLHRDLINSNQFEGVNIGLGYDLLDVSRSPKLANHIEDANNIATVGMNTIVGLQPVSDPVGPMGTFSDALRATNIEVLDKFNNKDRPFIFRHITPEGNTVNVEVAIDKSNGKYRLLSKQDGRFVDIISNKTYSNIGSIHTDLFKFLKLDRR